MRTALILALIAALSAASSCAAVTDANGFTEHMTALVERGGSPRKLNGDDSKIDNAISVFPCKSEVTVKTIKVKQLPADGDKAGK